MFDESRIGLALAGTRDAWARAWAHSIVGSLARAAWRELRTVDLLDRVRATCWLALVAAGTALALRQVMPRVEPLTWIVPAAVALVAVVVMVATPGAGSTTRA